MEQFIKSLPEEVQTVIKTQKIGRDEYLANKNIFFVNPNDSSNSEQGLG